MTPEKPEADDPRLLEFALAIADAKPVDWEAARQSATDLDTTFESLHAIEALAREALRDDSDGANAPVRFTWGPLRALEKLGSGAFGEVWRAWDPALQREVALKLRRADAPGPQARWLDEARRLARVQHTNVLTVHGADVHDGRAGLWSDLVRGRTLEELLQELGPMSAEEAVAIGTRLCAALAAVHASGLVHGDLKTRNVMREGQRGEARGAGRIVLMDFGAAHESSGSVHAGSAATPLYSAPEVLAGGPPRPTSDVYALGVLLYRLVSGAHPIEALTMEDLRERSAAGAVVPLRERRADLPPAFVRAVEHALARDSAERFASAAEFERALEGSAAPAPRPSAAGPVRTLVPLLLGAALASAAWFAAPRWSEWFAPEFRVASGHPAITSTSDVVLTTSDRVANLGAAMCAVGDLDGDGRPEYAIASSGTRDGVGQVEIYSLGPDGHLSLRATWHGENAGDRFGSTIVGGNDLDGDGFPDVAVSAIGSSTGAPHAGSVSLFRGGHAIALTPALVLKGTRVLQDFGYALSMDGDVNGDGFRDLVIGAPGDDQAGPSAGRVFVFLGGHGLHEKPDFECASGRPHSQFGIAVTDGVDINGDGIADIAVGANWDDTDGPYAGAVYLFHGGAHPDGTPDLVLHGPGENAWFGTVLFGGADLDGDGDRDLVVSSLHRGGLVDGAGSVEIHRGGPHFTEKPWKRLRGGDRYDEFGGSFGAADVNGDGHTDLIVGEHYHSRSGRTQGAIDVFFGGPAMDETCDWWLEGHQAQERFGEGLATLPPWATGELAGLLVSSSQHEIAGEFQGGRVTRIDFHRYTLQRPRPAERVPAAGVTLAWSGAEPARIDCSSDGGRSWQAVTPNAGGHAENTLVATPPAGATQVRWRITPLDVRIAGAIETADLRVAR